MSDDRAERRAIADRLDELLERLEAAREAGEITFLEMADRSLQAIDKTVRVLDLIPPEKVEVVFVDEFSNPMAPPKGTPPDPALLEAMRKHLLRKRAEDKAMEKEFDEL